MKQKKKIGAYGVACWFERKISSGSKIGSYFKTYFIRKKLVSIHKKQLAAISLFPNTFCLQEESTIWIRSWFKRRLSCAWLNSHQPNLHTDWRFENVSFTSPMLLPRNLHFLLWFSATFVILSCSCSLFCLIFFQISLFTTVESMKAILHVHFQILSNILFAKFHFYVPLTTKLYEEQIFANFVHLTPTKN